MNRVISWIQNILLRQILVVFLVAATFFVGQSFTYGTAMMAQANTIKVLPIAKVLETIIK